jgi:hypothetical protein
VGRPELLSLFLWGCALLWICSLALAGIIDSDFWFHLSSGRYTLAHGHPPITDTFSYPSFGRDYICLHWLFQLLLYACHAALGTAGLLLLKAVLVPAVVAGFAKAANLRLKDGSLLLLAFVTLGCSATLTLRPLLPSLILLSLFLLVWRREGPYWLFPLLELVWVNTHGLFILGLFVVGVWSLHDLRRRIGMLLLTIGACFINPYGWRGVLFPFTLFTRIGDRNVYSANIQEFASASATRFYTGNAAGWACLALTAAVAATAIIAWRRGRRKDVLSALLLFAGFFFIYTRAMRNMPLFALTAGWIIARLTPELLAWKCRKTQLKVLLALPFFIGALALYLRPAIVGYRGVLRRPYAQQRFARLATYEFPREAVEYLNRHHWRGRLFNDFNWGGYLTYTMGPEVQVFIDPRLEVHSRQHFSDYIDLTKDPQKMLDLDGKYDFDLALFSYAPCRGLPRLFEFLRSHPDWQLVYADAMAAIFCKNRPANQALIANPRLPGTVEIDTAELRERYLASPLRNLSFWKRPDLSQAYRENALGHLALYRRRPREAMGLLLQAAQANPQIGDSHFFLAAAALATRDPELFFTALDCIATIQPKHPELAGLAQLGQATFRETPRQ